MARRLAARLREKGWGYREFQRKVREATGGARGTSYGSIWAYVNGEVVEPRPWIVAAMADVLGLSREWLAHGTGPRTREEEARRALPAAEGGARDEHMHALIRAMEMARHRLASPEAELLSRPDRILETLVVDLLESGGRDLASYGEGEVAEAVILVAWLLALPLRMLDPGERGRRVAAAGGPYVLAMASALRAALPRAPGGHPYNVLSRLRRLRSALGEAGRGEEAPGRGGGGAPTRH